MKIKLYVAALFAAFSIGLLSSCEDMFDIPSNRVVIEPEIGSTLDSVYYTLGVLHSMRKVADRYVILGEVRGDMALISENTKTSLRNLANFNFDTENEYLNVRDYYNVINNCNYALAKMDTTLAVNNQRVMIDEYAAMQGIRAWTYLQLAINYGKVPYYTYPIISEGDVDKAYAEGKKDIKAIAADLALQLTPYLDYELPSFAGTSGNYPILRLVLADLYLWSGDYEGAVNCYKDYFMKNKKRSYTAGSTDPVMQPGYYSLGGNFVNITSYDPDRKKYNSETADYVKEKREYYNSAIGRENLACIQMEVSGDDGIATDLPQLFNASSDKTHLRLSDSWKSINAGQALYKYAELKDGKDTLYVITTDAKDLRSVPYWKSMLGEEEGEILDSYNKFFTNNIIIYRRSIAYLRWAEALNSLAKQRYDVAPDSKEARQFAEDAFHLLKDASLVFFPKGSEVRNRFNRFEKEIQAEFTGVHARGCPDVALDTTVFILDLAKKYKSEPSNFTFNDTIEYIDNLIIDELALESTLEGNRFGDLIRFAKRRQAWGDGNYRDFLAKRVAERGVNEEETMRDEELYNKLNDSEEYWYLPFK